MFSTKPICVEFYPRTSSITIAGDRTARWAKQLHAARRALSLSTHVERSPRNLCSAGYTTFTGLLRNQFLRPTVIRGDGVRNIGQLFEKAVGTAEILSERPPASVLLRKP